MNEERYREWLALRLYGELTAEQERELDAAGFFHVEDMRPTMVRNLRTVFQRAQLTEQEVRTLHGVVSALGRTKG